jgi:hypothetical protein
LTKISKRWQSRIIDTVRWKERQPLARQRQAEFGTAPGSGYPTLVIASADIEHDQVGACRIAKGEWDPALFVAGDAVDELQVFNGREKIWSGSRVLAVWPSFRWLSPADEPITGIWMAQTAWSATRIRGVASAAIAAGATGTIGSVQPINGHYASSNATVFMPTAFVSVESDVVVWAELAWDAVTKLSRWEVYSADCQEAGG